MKKAGTEVRQGWLGGSQPGMEACSAVRGRAVLSVGWTRTLRGAGYQFGGGREGWTAIWWWQWGAHAAAKDCEMKRWPGMHSEVTQLTTGRICAGNVGMKAEETMGIDAAAEAW